MRDFYIFTNHTKDPELELTNEIRAYLDKKGCRARMLLHDEMQEADAVGVPAGADCILVLGGDGTLLKAARETAEANIPLIGINLGTLGFLAEVEKNAVTQCLDHLIADQYEIEDRMLLDGEVIRGGKSVFQTHAWNDIVVNRCGSLMVLSYEVIVNGQLLNRYQADGMIVATPTGSTGYNMSAGGPIVEPRAQLMVLTPICPHTLNTRSIVLPAGDTVEIVIGQGRSGQLPQAEVNFDGSMAFELQPGDRITMKRSRQSIRLLHMGKVSFLETLHKKMSESGHE